MILDKVAVGIIRAGGDIYNIELNDGDETQFDAYDLPELLECWIDFCAGNGFRMDGVDYVERA